ncbi:MAG: hypothetical protein WEB13_09990 [Dehalococcoidia bacterium]
MPGATFRRSRSFRWGVASAFMLAETWGALYYLGRTWGSTSEERQRTLPGDAIVERPAIVTDHAIDVEAPAERTWPWLVQMGRGRGGWYTHRWVDRLLFPANGPSAEAVLPQFQQLAAGDTILDGPPETGCFFTVERLEPDRALVLRSHTHLPPQLLNRPGVALDCTWTFVLEPLSAERTRFHFRSRITARPWWLVATYRLFLVPADFVMARSMCRGVKERAERSRGVAGG